MTYQDYLEVTEYKGNKILNIPVGINQNWAFGFTKAVILSNYSTEIKTFVDSEGTSAGNPDVVISEFKEHPVLELPTHKAKYPLRFGIGKAKAILDNLKWINEFIADNEAEYLESHGFKDIDTVDEDYLDSKVDSYSMPDIAEREEEQYAGWK